jgi:hypothetical protein
MWARPLSSMKIIWRTFSRDTSICAARLPKAAFLPAAVARAWPISVARSGSSAPRPETERPNRFLTLPALSSETMTCSPQTGMPRKVCW